MTQTSAVNRHDSRSEASVLLWFLSSCFLLIGIGLILLVLVLAVPLYGSRLFFLVALLCGVGLVCAGLLEVRAWRLGQQVSDATEREFTSIYHQALDAILVLDDDGVCLDANPAAFALLGVPPAVLVGHCFAQFYSCREEFDQQWRNFLALSYQRGLVRLIRADGMRVFVHVSATANYVLGRHVVILSDATERIEAQDSLRESKERLQQMADSIQEIFWLLDASTKEVLQVNRAYETITGRSIQSLTTDPKSYSEVIHTDDRARAIAKLDEAVISGHLDEEFRITRPDGEIRWVWVHGFPVRSDSDGKIRRLAGTVLDITARKLADAQIAKHLASAVAARDQADALRVEAESLRRATLALTQNLRMDAVLDTFLASVFEIIPYDSASVLLTENNERLFVARESPPNATKNRSIVIVNLSENVFLERALFEKRSLQIHDTHEEDEWHDTRVLAGIRSWMAVPLIIGDSVLGLLSIGNRSPRRFSTEHLRLAKSLAIPAAVAIHNARLYEWAAIYAAERESLLKKAKSQDERDGLLH